MGFPLRSNIFQSGTNEQRYFRRFPVQVAVLFSPADRQFSDSFKDIFTNLDSLTGDLVAFFAVLDPPADWLQVAANRPWWQRYRERIGESGFTYEDRILVNEIARIFNVAWHELPVLVASTDLWTGECIVAPTTPWHIERQLTDLTSLVNNWGVPGIEQIFETLGGPVNNDIRYQPADEAIRYRLQRVYGALDAYDPRRNTVDINQFRRYTDRELGNTMQGGLLDRVRQRQPRDQDQEQDNKLVEEAIAEVAGRLVAPATVAMRAFAALRERDIAPAVEALADESLVMIETALAVGSYLEAFSRNALQGIAPISLRDRNRDIRGNTSWARPVDFTPGAQGAWKSLELELNLSIIQAARAARNIQMPQYFAQYVTTVSKDRSRIRTGTNRRGQPEYRDINAPDPHSPHTGRHKFLTLGEAWHITQAMLNDTNELLGQVIRNSIGDDLPRVVLDGWQEVHRIRNAASHTVPLSRNEYEQVIRHTLMSGMLVPLMQLKQTLSR